MALDVIILCGGKGSRIRSVLGETPKILAPINGQAFIDYILTWIRSSFPGIPLSFYLSTGIGHDHIENYVIKSSLDCILSREPKPLGTLGAVIDVVLRNNLNDDILVVNGDTIFDVDFNDAYDKFTTSFLRPLLIVKPTTNSARYGGYSLINSELKLTTDSPEFISLGAFFCTCSLIRDFSNSLHSIQPYLMLDHDFLDRVGTCPYIVSSNVKFIDIGVPADYSYAQTLVPSLLKL